MDYSENYFQLFGIEPGFDLDLSYLKNVYRELQRATHPDRFVNAADRERRLSVQQAARINDAFNTLKNPVARATYLLELLGMKLNEQNSTVRDPAFLMEQMELREALVDIRHAANPLDALSVFMDGVSAKTKQLTSEISARFSDMNEVNQGLVVDLVRKLQFMQKLQQEAEALEAELED